MTEEIKMLPVRQKQIVERIKALGFKQMDFMFKPIDNESFSLHYNPNTNYHIVIQTKKHYLKPAQDGRMVASGDTANWDTALIRVEYWLKALKDNVDIGNPWEEIEQMKEQMNEMNFDSYEEVFNEEEQGKIIVKLDQLFSEINMLGIDTKIIMEDISHLKEMSNKVSKKDFILLLIGTVASWIFSNILSPEHTQIIWGMVKTLFSSLKIKLLYN